MKGPRNKNIFQLYFTFLVIKKSCAIYTEETPVKLLEVAPVADRYPASESQYRISITDGYDEDAHRTEAEALNNFPENRTILNPGGCAVYVLPVDVEDDQIFALIHPGRKEVEGQLYEYYCPKGRVEVEVTSNGQKANFSCFLDPEDCKSNACVGDFQSILEDDTEDVELSLCVPVDEVNTASIWEINVSKANESSSIQGVFMDGAKERFQLAQTIPDFNKQLSLVSIVGARGVGKSTVSSLLSGNHSMFTTGSGSVGTTTTGADISTIIPTTEYAEILGTNLGITLNQTNEVLPLFLIDSEGMGVRGDAFDFITTSPPAVIAKVIVWIGVENLQTVEILEDINEYLNGLDNIIMDDGARTSSGYQFCDSPNYGHFIVVINKMMGDASDEQLQLELMTDEPDYLPGAEERNEIRLKLRECFDGISVHGLPTLVIEDGQEIDYPILSERFKGGLAAMANVMLEKSLYPRTVSVGGVALELNSTTAEVIISTVIEEANEGKIDLTGFKAFWKFITWKVENEMFQTQNSLDLSLPLCQVTNKAVSCSSCACAFRNDAIEDTLNQIDEIFMMGAQQALEMFGEDVSQTVADIYEESINPWTADNSCSSMLRLSHGELKSEYCDFSEMTDDFINPNNGVTLSCTYAFICDFLAIESTNVSLTIDNIYMAENTNIDLMPPPKALHGEDAQTPGSDGGDGEDGTEGSNLFIHANKLMKGSRTSFIFTSRGGDGGDGGKGAVGMAGQDGANGAPGINGTKGSTGNPGVDATEIGNEQDPMDANAVCAQPTKVEIDSDSNTWTHCICLCKEHDWWKKYRYDLKLEVFGGEGGKGGDGTDGTKGQDGGDGGKGGKGGNGGNGGKGGPAGAVFVSGIELKPIVNQVGGKGGLKGKGGNGGTGGGAGEGGKGGMGGEFGDGGPGGMGLNVTRQFFCKHHHDDDCDCNNWNPFDCPVDTDEYNNEYSQNFLPYVPCCQGRKGDNGLGGSNGDNGANGNSGPEGEPGVDGVNGSDA